MSTETDALTNEAIPRTQATLTIRIVKSFEFRTEKHLVLKNINCETTTAGQLKEIARQGTLLLTVVCPLRLTLVQRSRCSQDGSRTITCSLVREDVHAA